MKGPCMQFNQWCDETKKSYGSHMNANIEENAIQMCSKIMAPSHNWKNAVLFITISNIIWLDLLIILKTIHSQNNAYYGGSSSYTIELMTWQNKRSHMVVIWIQLLRRKQFKCVPTSGHHHTMEKCYSFHYHIKYYLIRVMD